MKLTKHIADIITSFRILCSVGILCFSAFSPGFFVMYLICGFSDMIDGEVARKTGTVSKFGARLDTASDFVFALVCCIKILTLLHLPLWLWMWIALVALTKIFNIAVVFIRKKKLLSIHSALNKTTGFALFLLPLSLTFAEAVYSAAMICVLATVAVMQEVYFVAKGQEVL